MTLQLKTIILVVLCLLAAVSDSLTSDPCAACQRIDKEVSQQCRGDKDCVCPRYPENEASLNTCETSCSTSNKYAGVKQMRDMYDICHSMGVRLPPGQGGAGSSDNGGGQAPADRRDTDGVPKNSNSNTNPKRSDAAQPVSMPLLCVALLLSLVVLTWTY
jgi:hypothetical protein